MMVSVHDGRRHPILAFLIALALVTLMAVIPPVAAAAGPDNDDIGAAIAIGSLPFTDTLDTTQATPAVDDPNCLGNGPTVWYAFTATSNIHLSANTFGSTYDTTISVYTGAPGALTQIACNDDSAGVQSQVVVDATEGQTYFIMAGAFGSGSGGSLTLTLREAPPPPPPVAVTLSIDHAGFVDEHGMVNISGTVTCNQQLFVSLFGSLTQTFANRFTVEGSGGDDVRCTPPIVPWKLTVFAFSNGPFSPGRAEASVNAFACNSVGCGSDQKSADLTLRPSRR